MRPCCGSGNFLIQALKSGFQIENIYGFDIDSTAIEISKARLKQYYELHNPNHNKNLDRILNANIQSLDFIDYCSVDKSLLMEFDYVFTNPAWGKKYSKNKKIKFSKQLNIPIEFTHDSCSIFLKCCLKVLKDKNSYLGFLLPDSFFNITAFKPAREEILKYKVIRLSDYGKIFHGLQTNAVWIEFQNQLSKSEIIECEYKNNIVFRNKNTFINNPNYIFNVNCTLEEIAVLEYMLNIEHITLKNNAEWALGIITGNNNKWIKNKKEENYIPIYKGSDLLDTKNVKPVSNFIYNDFTYYQQLAPMDMYLTKEKLIYKFISSDLCFHYDTEQKFVLNSANIVIPNDNFPINMETIANIFNSELMNWFFKKMFNTHKVLRKDIEMLPLYIQFIQNNSFNEESYLQLLGIEKIIKTSNGKSEVSFKLI